jgi:hypothetical protein
MIDVHNAPSEKTGTVSRLVRSQGLEIERGWMLRSVLHKVPDRSWKQDKMPNGDPPSLMLWGTEDNA